MKKGSGVENAKKKKKKHGTGCSGTKVGLNAICHRKTCCGCRMLLLVKEKEACQSYSEDGWIEPSRGLSTEKSC